MSRRPLDQFDPVAVGVGQPRCPRTVWPTGLLLRFRGEAGRDQGLAGVGQIVYLDSEVTESCTELHGIIGRSVHQLEGADGLVRERLTSITYSLLVPRSIPQPMTSSTALTSAAFLSTD